MRCSIVLTTQPSGTLTYIIQQREFLQLSCLIWRHINVSTGTSTTSQLTYKLISWNQYHTKMNFQLQILQTMTLLKSRHMNYSNICARQDKYTELQIVLRVISLYRKSTTNCQQYVARVHGVVHYFLH